MLKMMFFEQDWSDLWRPELAGKIAMVDSPREIIGAVLKHMGASYNTTSLDSQIVGGKQAVFEQLELLIRQVQKIIEIPLITTLSSQNYIAVLQVRLFDSQHYLKAFRSGDVLVAVGWSSDVLPVAKTMSNVSVMVPKSGSSLWTDFWVILEPYSHLFVFFDSYSIKLCILPFTFRLLL